ncbi:MAG: hypothetical protein AAFR47_21695 [Pseudomonadota bacterium]
MPRRVSPTSPLSFPVFAGPRVAVFIAVAIAVGARLAVPSVADRLEADGTAVAPAALTAEARPMPRPEGQRHPGGIGQVTPGSAAFVSAPGLDASGRDSAEISPRAE